MTIGERIAELRKQQGMSQEALGEALNVTRQSISKWEGDKGLPELEKLIAMSRLFNVSVGALLGVEETQDKPKQEGDAQPEELTDAQKRMVEEIVARYTAAIPTQKPRKKWPVFLCAAAIVGVFISLFARLKQMDENYRNLNNSIYNISNSVNRDINSITARMETILNEQNALTADFGCVVSAVDIENQKVLIDVYAIPKVYQEGLEVEFIAEYGEHVLRIPGQSSNTTRFSGQIACPFTEEEVTVSAVFTRDGVKETQLLDNIYWLAPENLLPISVFQHFWENDFKAAEKGKPFSMSGYDGIVHINISSEYYPCVPEPMEIRAVRVGLFQNDALLAWAEVSGGAVPEPTPAEELGQASGIALPAGVDNTSPMYKYVFPECELTVSLGDELAILTVITDQFGHDWVFCDEVYKAVSESSFGGYVWENIPSKGDASEHEWVYWTE